MPAAANGHSTNRKSSSAETAAVIRRLLQPVSDVRADAARLDELRRVLGTRVTEGDLHTTASVVTTGVTNRNSSSAALTKWRRFLKASHAELVRQLCERISGHSTAGSAHPSHLHRPPPQQQQQLSACRTLWGVMATTPVTSNNGKYQLIDTVLLLQFFRAIARSTSPDNYLQNNKQLRHMLEAEFLGPYRDVQYYGLIAIAAVANELYQKNQAGSKSSNENHYGAAERLVELLIMIPLASSQKELDSAIGARSVGYLFPPPVDAVPDAEENEVIDGDSKDDDSEEELESEEESDDEEERPHKRAKQDVLKQRFTFQDMKRHRAAWSKAWLAVLRLPLSESTLKQTLRFLPESVLPVATNPLRFADFFMNAYSDTRSSVAPLLALEGLFLLMTKHGLEYADFYKQLYRLIMSPSLLYMKHRTKFCRLLDKCLTRNDMLPAHLVAAFSKRLLRSSLSAPPASCMFVLALCSNLLRKHPETVCLVHRQHTTKCTDNNDDDENGLEDVFDAVTDDPEQANALNSSLWELNALEQHYYPPVVTLAKSIGRENDDTPFHNIADFVSLTYGTLFEQERHKRKQRNAKTALTFQKPASLFAANDVFAGVLDISKKN